MALKERLVDGDVLDANRGIVAVHLHDLVDEEKRIAMRQQFHDARNIRRAQFPGLSLRFAFVPVTGLSYIATTNRLLHLCFFHSNLCAARAA